MDEKAKQQLASIVDQLQPQDKEYISKLPEYRVIELHHSLGRAIRNQYRGGGLVDLFKWSRSQLPATDGHMDNLSWPIIMEVWRATKVATGQTQFESAVIDYKRDYNSQLSLAAAEGDSLAQLMLGSSYAAGLGIRQDYTEAYFWLSLSSRENPKAEVLRDESAAHLTPGQRDGIDKRILEWRPAPKST